MRAIITVVGKDTVGILAKISAQCAEHNVNVIEVSQSILQDMFCMIMLVDVSKCNIEFTAFAENCKKLGEDMGLVVNAMHEDIFNTMHRI
ncbi:MAG TPA: ACT domain-containing protein [Ruminococcaceae bacterium]|nr:ACT domain-containing protein [Oscillospiraceae bacterium]